MLNNTSKSIVEWWAKIRLLKDQINKLEQLKDAPIIAIAAFLLKSQIIEFELKQLIFSIDLYIYSNTSGVFRRRVRTPRDLDNLTLRKLVREIEQFVNKSDILIKTQTNKSKNKQLDTLGKLKKNLNELVNKRDKLTHHLFDSGKNIRDLNNDALKGIEIASNTLILIEKLEKEIKKYEK